MSKGRLKQSGVALVSVLLIVAILMAIASRLLASHNLVIQQIFTPLTTKGEGSHFYIDEFGIMMPIFGIFLALFFYKKAVREGIA